MQNYLNSVTNTNGVAISGATVTVLKSDGTVPILYAANGSSPYSTNVLTTDATGEYSFYAANGTYTIAVSAPGFTRQANSGIVLYDPISTPVNSGFWADTTPATVINRIRDRLFVGDGATHTGNQNAPYGSTQLATAVANWPEKNAQAIVESTNGRIGLLGVSCLVNGQTSGASIAVAGFAQASLASGTSRALYGDATLESGATAVYGAELATANRGTNTVANPYSAPAGAYGLKIAQESAIGYLLGDASTAAPQSTSPGTAAILVQAGTGAASVNQYNTGLLFYSNSLVGNDGTTGTSEAISMGKGMAINWYSGSAPILGATIRSDVTASANHDVSMIFTNDTISLNATASASSVPMLQLTRDTAGAGGVNYLTLANARTNTNSTFQVAGSDTNSGINYKTKGTGIHQFSTNATEAFRIAANPASAVNFAQVVGSATTNPVVFSFQGTDTDGDVAVRGKGVKGGQLQDGATAVKFQWNTTGIGFFAATPAAQTTGYGTPTGTGVIANFPGATATLAQCSQAIAQIIADMKKFGLYGA